MNPTMILRSCLLTGMSSAVARFLVAAGTLVALGLVVLACPLPVLAAETAVPGWEVTSSTFPTYLAPSGGTGTLELNVYNVGAAPSSGQVTVTDSLPPGVLATQAGDVQFGDSENLDSEGLWECSGNAVGESPRKVGEFEPASVVTCVNSPSLTSLPILDSPELTEAGRGAILHLGIGVTVQGAKAETLTNEVTVSGGGAPSAASSSGPVTVSSAPAPPFGFQSVDGWASRSNGTLDSQAGSHPYDVDFTFDLNTERDEAGVLTPTGGRARDLAVKLPPGLVGNPTAVPQCTRTDFDNERCNPDTQVGTDVANALRGEGTKLVPFRVAFAVYNLVPPPGLPAQFAFVLGGVQVFLDAGVRSGGDYGITVHANALPQANVYVFGNRVVLWGEPSDPSHDGFRFSTFWENKKCGQNDPGNGCPSSAPRVPFLTLASACGGAQSTTASVDAWETHGFGEVSFLSHDANFAPAGITGCEHLTFAPSISVAPDTSFADTPAGLTVDVSVPQEGLVTPGALATSNIKDATVVLPAGVVINPGQAAGLQACKGGDVPGGDDLPLPGENGEEERFDGPPDCPNAAKVGTIKIVSPLLKEALEGDVYVLQSNPPHLKLLFAASGEGVNIKLIAEASECETAGETLDEKTCEAPGQLITKVTDAPQLPFTDFKLSFSGGAQAALDTPTKCGTYTTTSDFEPWSAPAVGHAFPSSNFLIGPGCPPSPLGYSPSLTAGSTTDQAGGFTDFSLLLRNGDGQKRTERLQFRFPPGFLAFLGNVALCPEPQAAAGTCSEGSKIGHVTVASGPGPYPLTIPQPGDPESPMYITGPYNGTGPCNVDEAGCAPFGLAIVTHVIAGPFNLGTIVTRGKIEVDPRTLQITITTNPLPQVVDGVPTDLRLINAVADRERFLVNPTNCSPFSFSGTAWGIAPPGNNEPGVTVPIESPFQVGSCRSLSFSPSFKARASGKTSKKNGASLSATLSYPATPPGTGQATSQAGIRSVKVELPKQLPSRLTTLQKACTAAQFNKNPAGCPSASVVGQALVHTPLLPVPVSGPAYFVSHGGEAFPALVLLLQGYGVTVDVEATTFISKKSVTSLTFKTAPDAPFSSFTLTSPQGPYSALAANGNLCAGKLVMPTELVAQNGAVLHQNTKISVTGCPKTKTAPRAKKLARALKACHKDKNKTRRQRCEQQARRQYAPPAHKKTKKR
jgi:hypothetical protein